MTTTTIMNAQTAGTGSNVGDIFNAVKTTLQATTSLAFSAFAITSTALNNTKLPSVTLWQAVSPTSYASAAIGAAALKVGAISTTIKLSNPSILTYEKPTDTLLTCGGGTAYHYAWLEVGTLTDAIAVTVKLQELP